GNGLSGAAARTFGESTGLPALTELDLGPAANAYNRLGTDGLPALGSGARSGRVRKLNVARNRVADAGVEGLGAQPPLCNPGHVALSFNALTNRAAPVIAGAEHLKTLEHLNLSGNAISDEGARALAASHFENIRLLDLSGCRIGKKAAGALRERFGDRVI